MPFFSDVLRVVGVVGGAALVATGVASPLGGALIGAAASGVGNFGADAIDREAERRRADEAAAQQRREAEAKLEQQKRDAEARSKQIQDELNKKLEHEALPVKVIDACRTNQLANIPELLKQMDDKQFDDLGLTPLASCTSATAQQQVLDMLEVERRRRGK